MNSGNRQNSMFLSSNVGMKLLINIGVPNGERTCSNHQQQNQTWIHPPGKSNNQTHCSCCPHEFLNNCITLNLPGNDNGNGLSTPLMQPSGLHENITASSKSKPTRNASSNPTRNTSSKPTRSVSSKPSRNASSKPSRNASSKPTRSASSKANRKVSRQTSGRKQNRISKQDQTHNEINKLLEEKEMRRETFEKYIEEINITFEDIGIDMQELENKQNRLSQKHSKLNSIRNENTRNKGNNIKAHRSNLPKTNMYSKNVEGVQSIDSESFQQPVFESTRLSFESKKGQIDMDHSMQGLLLRNFSMIASKSTKYSQIKGETEENAKPDTNAKFLGKSGQCELMKTFADSMHKLNLSIDGLYQRNEAVDTKLKKYVPAVENLYQEQFELLERFYPAIGTSSSDSSVDGVLLAFQNLQHKENERLAAKNGKPIDGD